MLYLIPTTSQMALTKQKDILGFAKLYLLILYIKNKFKITYGRNFFEKYRLGSILKSNIGLIYPKRFSLLNTPDNFQK